MTNQQTRRRRKRYQPGSAYAGDVRPKGVFRLFGNVRLFFFIGAAIMVGSLFVGGILRSGVLGSNSSNSKPDFVVPTESAATGAPTAQPTLQIKRYSAAPELTIDPSKQYTATIRTSLGDIQVQLFDDQVPQTVNNFVFLARDGFYNGLTFHQVVSGFDAQAGDPGCQAGRTEAASCRGNGDPGYTLPQEKPGSFTAGQLGMANASQFFIALGGNVPSGQFTPFGEITTGLDVAQQITQGTPIETVTIQETG